mmetsp:Transcript_28179/g.45304  ORF Transcript_28179/g.45304 Transcript_28179/m.45304 type:complete len:101 (+) Transcript_28179:34-336(+)
MVFMTANSRPVHGGYPQPADWSAWPWCTDAVFIGNFDKGLSNDGRAMECDAMNNLKRTWMDAEVATDIETAIPKRHCGLKVLTVPTRKRTWQSAQDESSG